MTSQLALFCLVEGESTANAFSVKATSAETVDDLKVLIKTKLVPHFDDIAAKDLTLWHSRMTDEESPITIETLNKPKPKKLRPTADISDVFPDAPVKKTVHTIVQRLLQTQDLGDDFALHITLKDNNATTLTWYTRPTIASLDD
ncbi:hypothetical protein BG011_005508 [Mortierella polycephala]|uniref:Crinkler effector protein N-terminal domain-containing protein n=1 Tax=Mortierella polycephala TaxID=41804 RepID=A0A9P6PYX5_9FUNG|nr:hypothetical protein BG011_005508 [Mortierella polycephala]